MHIWLYTSTDRSVPTESHRCAQLLVCAAVQDVISHCIPSDLSMNISNVDAYARVHTVNDRLTLIWTHGVPGSVLNTLQVSSHCNLTAAMDAPS